MSTQRERRPADICIPYFAKFLRIKTFEPLPNPLVIGRPVVKSALQALSSSASSPGGRPALTVLELLPDVQCQGGASPARSRHPRAIYSFEREIGRLKSESGCVATSRTFVSSPRDGGQFDDERRHFPACRFGPSTGTARRPLVSTRESSHAGSAIASSML